MDACSELADASARIAASSESTRRFLIDLGAEVGGVRRGLFWPLDAATGGSNRLRGRGFRRHVDDGTDGQARHFAGIAAVAARVGAGPTRWLSIHVGRDAPDTADGRLTDHAIDFVRLLRSGELAPTDAPDWIRRALCTAD
ncbi:hypothetical protein ACFVWR_17715 [Leifsonia sp. NPDC058292]|uniref:hypothetical protein n=1 Tax=Leifsonia sp. NPDC058292 TaxID=3346428 RepID=UPI0036DED4F8